MDVSPGGPTSLTGYPRVGKSNLYHFALFSSSNLCWTGTIFIVFYYCQIVRMY